MSNSKWTPFGIRMKSKVKPRSTFESFSKYRVTGCSPACGCIVAAPVLLAFVVILLMVSSQVFGLEGNEVAYIGAAILVSLFFPAVILAVGVGIGLLWAPFAALFCAHAAGVRGFESRRYALAGAVYSILFFWPWVYLIARMYGRTIPSPMIRLAYILLYGVIWPSIALSFIPSAFGFPHPLWIICPILILVSAVTWSMSIRRLTSWHRRYGHVSQDLSDDVFPSRIYIMPFAHAFLWLLVAIGVWWQANWPLWGG